MKYYFNKGKDFIFIARECEELNLFNAFMGYGRFLLLVNGERVIARSYLNFSWVSYKKCEDCGKWIIIIKNDGNIKYCEECSIKRYEISRNVRNSKWAEMVKERDGLCLECGSEFELEAHHIVPISIDFTKARDVDNGITLCKYCHRVGVNAVH